MTNTKALDEAVRRVNKFARIGSGGIVGGAARYIENIRAEYRRIMAASGNAH